MTSPVPSPLLLLPLELRQLIYQFSFHPAEDHEVVVELTWGKGGRLRCDFIPLISSLSLVNRQIHDEIIPHFFGRSRFCFTDMERPCRYILDAFMKQTPRHHLKMISKVSISYFSLVTLEPSDWFTRAFLADIACHPDPDDPMFLQPSLGSNPNLCRPSSKYLEAFIGTAAFDIPSPDNLNHIKKAADVAASDMIAGMEAVANSFSSLKRLDLGLHLFEWSVSADHVPEYGLLMRSLKRLNSSPMIDDMHIRLQWNGGIHNEDQTLNGLNSFWNLLQGARLEDWVRGEQQEFIELCRSEVNAREVTGDDTRLELGKEDPGLELLIGAEPAALADPSSFQASRIPTTPHRAYSSSTRGTTTSIQSPPPPRPHLSNRLFTGVVAGVSGARVVIRRALRRKSAIPTVSGQLDSRSDAVVVRAIAVGVVANLAVRARARDDVAAAARAARTGAGGAR
ncbi:hypothetical protein K458DRAFT_490667 [Lentithecium fluviatile CBS 122367]|uniref:F-box domain-containing protein n=1 Tax=Lentithecium fluviatile CBS 122367 TaxID=1168545 RepID=A0A6G1IM91_9PLEO|nr:hypothetical protein K458DRAFT_490667 [Lentithecium fluviatile CBS 122367]